MAEARMLPPILTEENLRGPWVDGEVGKRVRWYVVELARLNGLVAELEAIAATGRWTEAGRHENELARAQRDAGAIEGILVREVAQARARWLEENPPPPDPGEVARYQLVYLACGELLEVESDRAARRTWERLCDEWSRLFGTHRMMLPIDNEPMLARERAVCAAKLAEYEVDLPESYDDVDRAAL